jgi:NitT/TauT family transport system substrate-binding protein
MKWPARFALGLFAVNVLTLMTACRSEEWHPPMRIAAAPWIGNTPFLAAQDKRLFGALEVRVVEMPTDFDVWRSVLESRADMSVGTAFDLLRAMDHGADMRIIMAVDFSTGADGIIGSAAIENVSSLKGRKVAVEKSTLTHFVLLRALQRAGMREEDVVLENLATDEALQALDEGRVDAAALWEPLLSQAKKPGRRVLFTSAELPGEIIDVLGVRADVLRDRPKDVDNIVRGFLSTVDQFALDRRAAAEAVSTFMELDVAVADKSLETVKFVDLSENVAMFDRTAEVKSLWRAYGLAAEFMQSHDMLRHPARKAEDVIDGEPLARAALARK